MYIIADCKTDGHSNMAEYKEFCGWFITSYAYINTCVCAFYLVAMDYIFLSTVGPRLSESPLPETSVIRTLFQILKFQKTV